MPRVREYKFDYFAARCLDAWERDKPKYVAVDTETSGFKWTDRPFCVSVAWRVGSGDMVCIGPGPGPKNVLAEDGVVYPYMKWKHKVKGRPERWEAHYLELDGFSAQVAQTILEHTPELVFHNAKFDIRMLIEDGILQRDELDPLTLHDTQTLSYLLDEHRRKGLKSLAAEVLGLTTNEEEVLKAARKKLKLKKADGYHRLPRSVIVPYAIKDAEFTIRLFHKLLPELKSRPRPRKDIQSLWELYLDEMELMLVLLDMETAGMGVDLEYVEAKQKEYARKALTTELSIRDMTGNEDFNPRSPKQLKEAFAERGLLLAKTDKQTLKEVDDPLAEAVMEIRSTTKMRSSYLVPMIEEAVDGVLHPNFNAAKTKTGRFSSSSAGG